MLTELNTKRLNFVLDYNGLFLTGRNVLTAREKSIVSHFKLAVNGKTTYTSQ